MDRKLLAEKLINNDFTDYDAEDVENILKASIKKQGRDHVLYICIEELSELTKELTKALRGSPDVLGIKEEFVDAAMALSCIEFIFNFNLFETDPILNIKLDRLRAVLEDMK